MRKNRFAIIGPGNVGRQCADAILADPQSVLAAVVRRPGSSAPSWPHVPTVSAVNELDDVDAALVCVPLDAVKGVVQDLLQKRIPVVECARLHDEAFLEHKDGIHRAALRHKVPAIVGAGCDPGVLSLLRSHFALLAPGGHTQTSRHTAPSLHHTLAASGIDGVQQALATEARSVDGRIQRYVYVELAPTADAAAVTDALTQDPLFLDEQTLVFPVPSIAALQTATHGITLERHAAPGATGHAAFLLEARYDEAGLAARMMVAAARALPHLSAGAYSLLDLPPGALWGEQRISAEKEWI